jgi:patatin-like phospholipase domain-containing protein 2
MRYDPENLEVSFAGCGFLGIYHIGVASAIQHFVPNCKFAKLCGASAGALAASALVAGIPVCK